MAYAPHDNVKVHQQLVAGQSPTELPLILGFFREDEAGCAFEYAERRHPDDSFAPDFPHVVYCGPAGKVTPYLAKVLKTVAYIVTDEAADGSPVVTKWRIWSHRNYDTQWVRA
jgi:hypothetical protein